MKGPKNDENGTEELLAEKKVFRFCTKPKPVQKKDTYPQLSIDIRIGGSACFLRVIWVLVEKWQHESLFCLCCFFWDGEREHTVHWVCVSLFFLLSKKKDEVSVTCSKGAPEESSRCSWLFLFSSFLVGLFVCLVLSIAFFGFFL